MSTFDSVTAPVLGSARRFYTSHLREVVADRLLRGGTRTLARRRLLDDPPSYLDDLRFVDGSETVTLAEPPGVGPLPESIHEKVGEWTFDRPFVAVLRNVQLVGPNALPIAPDGAYVLEAVDGSSRRVADGIVRTLAAGRLPVRRGSVDRTLETAVSLAGPWSREFFHWFADYLPRLGSLERYREATDEAPPLLLPADPPEWLAESLDLLGVPAGRRIAWTGGRVAVERLVVPSLPRHVESTAPEAGYIQSPRATGWVARRLREAVDLDDGPDAGRRLYVSRAGRAARDVVNEEDLLSTLSAHGFEVVHPERWSLPAQVAAFADAEAVCGPHGGGLVNVIYAPADATLLELFGARTNPCFYALAVGTGRRYAAHHATAAGDHLRVDSDALDRLLALADEPEGWASASK